MPTCAHSHIALNEWDQLTNKPPDDQSLAIEGTGLSVAKVVSVSR